MQEIAATWATATSFFAFDASRLLEPGMLVALTLQVFLLCGSAFFSGSETALFSLSRLDLQKLRRDRHPRSETLHALLDQPRRLIISILCGNELVNIAATANLVGILVYLYGEDRAGFLMQLAKAVPHPGTVIESGGATFTIERGTAQAIEEIRIRTPGSRRPN